MTTVGKQRGCLEEASHKLLLLAAGQSQQLDGTNTTNLNSQPLQFHFLNSIAYSRNYQQWGFK